MKGEYSSTDLTTFEDLKLALTGMIVWEKDKEWCRILSYDSIIIRLQE